jgi:hypothetical protein
MARQTATSGTRESAETPDGRKIFAREYAALAPHPHPRQNGRLVATRGVNKILVLSDEGVNDDEGVELYECDECGKTAPKVLSIVGHLPTHNPASKAPDYDVKIMRMLVDIVTKYRNARVRGYCERAATELNTLRVARRDGQEWNAGNVSALYNHWKDRPEVTRRRVTDRRTRGTAAGGRNGATEKRVTTSSVVSSGSRFAAPRRTVRDSRPAPDDALVRLGDLAHSLVLLADELTTLAGKLTQSPAVADAEVAELREKASRWDAVAGLLRG